MKDLLAATPPVTLASMSILGFPITDWAALVSIIWVFVLVYLKVSEKRKERRGCTCSLNKTHSTSSE
tara:strand:+ start:101 stop:301 length:201 start_codon:yes stop_codon:yes gene_type:complete